MWCVRIAAALFWVSILPVWGATNHNPLLPRPKQVRYGVRKLPLRALSISFVSKPGPEDRFTALELSSVLSKATGASIQVSDTPVSGHVITLRRVGDLDPLPLPGERTGPDSREAFSLKVTPEGAEVQARSSAGLYYGAQTLRQLIEGAGVDASLPEVEIHDWPSFAYRGIMVDTSHGPLPTEGEARLRRHEESVRC